MLTQQALPPYAAWLQLLVREPIMAGDVSDYLAERELPRTAPSEASESAGGGEDAEQEEERPVMERVGGAALRKVIKVSSIGQDTCFIVDGRIRVPLTRGWEAELRVAPPSKSIWTFAFD